jgi:hypothetical protein
LGVDLILRSEKAIEWALPGSGRRFLTIPHQTLRQPVNSNDGIVENFALTPSKQRPYLRKIKSTHIFFCNLLLCFFQEGIKGMQIGD